MSTEDYRQPDRREHPVTQTLTTNGPILPPPTPAPTPRTDLDELREHLEALDLNTGRLAELVEKAQAALATKDAEMVTMLGWIANKMLEPEWDSFKKAIAVTDHWKARAEKAEAELARAINRRDILAEQIAALDSTVAEFSKQNSELHAERDALRSEATQLRAEVEQERRMRKTMESAHGELLSDSVKLRAERAECERQFQAKVKEVIEQTNIADQLRADLAAAKEDAERYRYLRSRWDDWTGTTWSGNRYQIASQLDAAIDAARQAEGPKQGRVG